MLETIKASFTLALLILWIIFWCLPAWVAVTLKQWPWRDAIVQLCYKGILKIVGIRLLVKGEQAQQRPLLIVANHTSYLDMPIIGSGLPACFTPKMEVSSWPVIGGISRLCGCIFVDRRADKMNEAKSQILTELASGRVVCLFPEATTGDGLHMRPFKSGFFSLAEEHVYGVPLTVQPIAISYNRISGLPITSDQWPGIAWYSDMELAPHLWELLKLGPINATLTFLPPVTLQDFGDRKSLAAHCYRTISASVKATF